MKYDDKKSVKRPGRNGNFRFEKHQRKSKKVVGPKNPEQATNFVWIDVCILALRNFIKRDRVEKAQEIKKALAKLAKQNLRNYAVQRVHGFQKCKIGKRVKHVSKI